MKTQLYSIIIINIIIITSILSSIFQYSTVNCHPDIQSIEQSLAVGWVVVMIWEDFKSKK